MAGVLRRTLCQSGHQLKYTAICYSTKVQKDEPSRTLPNHRKLKSVTDSLADRGFLRSYKPYSPPEKVDEQVSQLAAALELTIDTKLTDLSLKFDLLKSCSSTFGIAVPNSILHEMRTVRDVIEFYSTPVDTTLPMDRIRNSPELPQNLHIQEEYVRYSPDDPMFERTAFPKSSTLVSGLNTRRKYKGHEAKRSWY